MYKSFKEEIKENKLLVIFFLLAFLGMLIYCYLDQKKIDDEAKKYHGLNIPTKYRGIVEAVIRENDFHLPYGAVCVVMQDGDRLSIKQIVDPTFQQPVIEDKIAVGDTIYKNKNSDTLYLIKTETGEFFKFKLYYKN